MTDRLGADLQTFKSCWIKYRYNTGSNKTAKPGLANASYATNSPDAANTTNSSDATYPAQCCHNLSPGEFRLLNSCRVQCFHRHSPQRVFGRGMNIVVICECKIRLTTHQFARCGAGFSRSAQKVQGRDFGAMGR